MSAAPIIDELIEDLRPLRFGPPVTHVYNPLEYAREPFDRYLERYGKGRREVLLLGMNPGPFGMAQVGVPFGEIHMVQSWLGIEGRVGKPENEHPKRQIQGFACRRSEVSGRRIWGWAKEHFGTPANFFRRFFVINYCPLVFMEATGRNLTPDKLPRAERDPLFAICDRAVLRLVERFQPRFVVGVGAFAEERALAILEGSDVQVGRILHPSPANPKANRGWSEAASLELREMGIEVP